jgi:hypothetical protein
MQGAKELSLAGIALAGAALAAASASTATVAAAATALPSARSEAIAVTHSGTTFAKMWLLSLHK